MSAESRSPRVVRAPFDGARPPVEIAPSILSADFSALARDLAKCRRARATWIHVDVMDGRFVPNITIGPPVVRALHAAEPSLFYDTHLMIEEPMRLVESFRDAGSGMITIHAEASENVRRDLQRIQRLGVRAGVSIKPATPVKAIEDCLPVADLVLVMTVEPGFGGQALIDKTLTKVRELDKARFRNGYNYRLQVDGGINARTAPIAVAAGADLLVAGSAVFSEKGTVAENIRALREAVAKAPMPCTAPKKPAKRRRRATKR
jgi:ribulose-phosphate 3-epimerase